MESSIEIYYFFYIYGRIFSIKIVTIYRGGIMNRDKAYNRLRESSNLSKALKENRKKYKDIVKELGVRKISLEDIAHDKKTIGFIDALDSKGATLDEMVVLQQYAKAIIDRDTKSAEFLRDTAGEKPSTQIDVNDKNENGIAKLTLDQLIELRDLLKQNKES